MEIPDSWAALQFDNAVRFLGITIENKLQERKEVGSGKSRKYVKKYTLEQLLNPNFLLHTPKNDDFGSFVEAVKRANFRNFRYVRAK